MRLETLSLPFHQTVSLPSNFPLKVTDSKAVCHLACYRLPGLGAAANDGICYQFVPPYGGDCHVHVVPLLVYLPGLPSVVFGAA